MNRLLITAGITACSNFYFAWFGLDCFLNESFEGGYIMNISRIFGPKYPTKISVRRPMHSIVLNSKNKK